ncbi:enoyl-[acyl-carrier-protein] reductase FabK [Clostridia bacterium]|nr:enoyl-[acyl-carrier-protein] reductase FabK [Clostridia bacterium]
MIFQRGKEVLQTEYPIIQGAMAWISESTLAAAVSEAGGLGVIAAGNAPFSWVKEEIRKARQITKKPLCVNVMLLSPYAEEVALGLVEEDIEFIITGAGNPGKYMDAWKKSGKKIMPVVPSTALAKRMEKSGADALIAEGTEAGGHIGEIATMALIPQIVDAVDIPVFAAGGIGDARGVLAAWMLGAEGVQVGTRFLLAHECQVHPNYKEKIMKAKDIDTLVTGRPTGHPVRVLKNALAREFIKKERAGCTAQELEALGAGTLNLAAHEGDTKRGSFMSGQIAGLLCEEQSCKEIIQDLYIGAEELFLAKYKEVNHG